MPERNQFLGVKFDRVYTSDEFDRYAPELGARAQDDAGREYRLIQANGAIAANEGVALVTGYDCDPVANGEVIWAVAPVALADGERGWVQVRGECTANVATGVSAGDPLAHAADTNGDFIATLDVDEGGATAHGIGDISIRAQALTAESAGLASVELF